MLFLLFQLGRDRYALDTADVVGVLPLVHIKRIPKTPAGVAGAFNYQGTAVPVVDLSELALNRAAHQHLSTRIVLVKYPDNDGQSRLLGLIIERATQTLRCEAQDFVDAGVANTDARYLGPVLTDENGLIQRIETNKLLSAPVRDVLFRQLTNEYAAALGTA